MEKYVKVNPTYTEVKASENACKWEMGQTKDYKEYRKRWYEYPKKQSLGNFPIHLDIEVSRRCNLRCPMCPRTLMLNQGKLLEEGDMKLDMFKKIIDEGAIYGLYSVKLNYLGEPLLNKDLIEMIKYAKRKGITDVMMNTNGALLTKSMAEKLVDSGIDKIFISFDSPDPKEYNSIRVGTDFDRVFSNVKALADIRNAKKKTKPIIRVSMVVMKENKDKVLDYIKLWKPIVDYIGFSDYINPQGMDKKDRYGIDIKKHNNFICPQLYQRLFIHWNGDIGLCCVDYDAECNLGNVERQGIRAVWFSKRMRSIRKLHTSGNYDKFPLCARCEMARA